VSDRGHRRDRDVRDPEQGKLTDIEAVTGREVVTMTTAVYPCCAAIRTVHTATGDSSWAFFAGLPAWPTLLLNSDTPSCRSTGSAALT